MAIYTLYDNLGMKLSVLCFRTGSFFRRKHIKRIHTNVENIDDANTEEAGDANTFNDNDLPHENASHQFIRWPQIYVLDV